MRLFVVPVFRSLSLETQNRADSLQLAPCLLNVSTAQACPDLQFGGICSNTLIAEIFRHLDFQTPHFGFDVVQALKGRRAAV
jgi:hypothetical protein